MQSMCSDFHNHERKTGQMHWGEQSTIVFASFLLWPGSVVTCCSTFVVLKKKFTFVFTQKENVILVLNKTLSFLFVFVTMCFYH